MNRSKGKARPKTSKKSLSNLLSQIRMAKGSPKQAKKQQRAARPGYVPGLLGSVGGLVGGYTGIPGASALGRRAGQWLGNITGMGAYRVNKNTLNSNSTPQFSRSLPGGAIEICHREFIQDVNSTAAFTLQAFPINPGLATTFPFLSQLAVNFEQYEMLGLIFEFKTTSATAVASTNTALGVQILSTNYDTLDANFGSKQQMEAYEYTVSTVPCESVIHPVECDPRQNTLKNMYVRTGAVPSGADQRFYDLGNFQIASVGSQATAVVGELWVSYHVRLLKPKLTTPLGSALPQAHIVESPAGSAAAAGSAFLGTTTGVLRAGNTLPIVCTKNTFTLPLVGVYAVSTLWDGSATVVATLTPGSAITAAPLVLNVNQSASIQAVAGGVVPGVHLFTVATAGTGAANTITISGLTSLATASADIIITQVSSNIL